MNKKETIDRFIEDYAETSFGEENLTKDIGAIFDYFESRSCETCMYSEKATATRWKCEWLDDIRVRPNFFCADYVKKEAH